MNKKISLILLSLLILITVPQSVSATGVCFQIDYSVTFAEYNSLDVLFDSSNTKTNNGVKSVKWDFGDNTTSTQRIANHTYDSPGTYKIAITVENNSGHKVRGTNTLEVSTISSEDIKASATYPAGCEIKEQPQLFPRFTVSQDSQDSTLIRFDASSSTPQDIINYYNWIFGDNSTPKRTTNPIIEHKYNLRNNLEEDFFVTLTVGNSNQDESFPLYVHVVNNSPQIEPPKADFIYQINDKTVLFDASPSTPKGKIDEYEWNFGNNQIFYGMSQQVTYTGYGKTFVTLKITSNGQSDSITKRIELIEPKNSTQSATSQESNPLVSNNENSTRPVDNPNSVTNIDPRKITSLVILPFDWDPNGKSLDTFVTAIKDRLEFEMGTCNEEFKIYVVTPEEAKQCRTKVSASNYPNSVVGSNKLTDDIWECAREIINIDSFDPNNGILGVTNRDRVMFSNGGYAGGYVVRGGISLQENYENDPNAVGNGIIFKSMQRAGFVVYSEEVALHETGHFFSFCEQYSKNAYENDLKKIWGCTNYYPGYADYGGNFFEPLAGTEIIIDERNRETYVKCPYNTGQFETNCPDAGNPNWDCFGRKIPFFGQIARSYMAVSGTPYPKTFDCVESDFLKMKLQCER